MKKLTLEATDENVLNSIANDKLRRSTDVLDFINMLESIDYNAFISLDAAWGDGKTFFVRQAEMTLRYHNKKVFGKEILSEEDKAFSANRILSEIELKHTYHPIYYDAWLYDNHNEPLMSLLFVIAKKCKNYLYTKINSGTIGDKICSLIPSINININRNVQASVDITRMHDTFKKTDILDEIKTEEEIRELIKDIFNDLIVEEAQRLIIFIDELDRCRPSYAIEMLERIKHYFDDERIIFVMSVNKEQLIHTISNYYGEQFDSSGYLNKFFDISIQLPPVDTASYFQSLGIDYNSSYWIIRMANELQKYHNLPLRDSTKYFQKMNIIREKSERYFAGDSLRLFTLLAPIICVLDIVDVQKKKKIINGSGMEILKNVVNDINAARKIIIYFSGNREDIDENFQVGLRVVEELYKYTFVNNNSCGWYPGGFEIAASFKRSLLRLCNEI